MPDSVAIVPVANGLHPPLIRVNDDNGPVEQGPQVARCFCTLTSGVDYVIDLQDEMVREQINNIQCIQIDNTSGLNALTYQSDVMLVPGYVPPGAWGVFPIHMNGATGKIILNRADGGAVSVMLLNVPQPYFYVDKDGSTTVVISGTVTVKPEAAATGALTNVAASAVPANLLAANSSRKGAYFFVDPSGTSNLFLRLGSGTVNTTNTYTVKVTPGSLYEVPPNFTGVIPGIWDGTSGSVHITETT